MSKLSFDGRVAIVTGAGSNLGLGRAHAMLLAERGAKVVINDIGRGVDQSGRTISAEAVAAEIRSSGGEAIADTNSVATEESAKNVIRTALDTWGRLDILINNAMVAGLGDFDELAPDHIQRIVDVNLMGTIWMSRAAWPQMVKASYGRIINTTSNAMLGLLGMTIYGAAKAGIFGLTRGLAAEGVPHNIKVNALSPGAATSTESRFFKFTDEQLKKWQEQMRPQLVSPVVGYLAHEACEVSGALIEAAAGKFTGIVFGSTKGFQDADLTIEQVRDNFDSAIEPGQISLIINHKDPRDRGKDRESLVRPS